jgi:predicted RNase H-like HicB family nuclease
VNRYKFAVVIEKDEDGYFALCPELDGCFTQGDSYDEIVVNIKDAIKLHIEDRLAAHEPIPHIEEISLTTMEVVV